MKKCGIVTVGGICPGLNDVIRSIVTRGAMKYNIPHMYGIPYGFKGFSNHNIEPIKLTHKNVENIHRHGGTILGTSREPLNPSKATTFLKEHKYDILFVLGGNGGNTAADILFHECLKTSTYTQIISLPKSIDNDINNIDKCFGFDTAVHEASKVLHSAKIEAKACQKGVTLVKLMGRHSGFIAAYAAAYSHVTDVCLIPEAPFSLNALTIHIDEILENQGHAVICMAEGVPFSRQEIEGYITSHIPDVYFKYIEPSYLIRATPTTSSDNIYCTLLGQAAMDAAMQNKSGVLVAQINGKITTTAIANATVSTKQVDIHNDLIWLSLNQQDLR
jgi:6-phosphofructokinase 1